MNPQAAQLRTIAAPEATPLPRRRGVDEWGLVLLPGYVLFHVGNGSLRAAAAFAPGTEWVLDDLVEWWCFALRDAEVRLDADVITNIAFYTREAISEIVEGDAGEEAGRTIAAALWARLDRISRTSTRIAA